MIGQKPGHILWRCHVVTRDAWHVLIFTALFRSLSETQPWEDKQIYPAHPSHLVRKYQQCRVFLGIILLPLLNWLPKIRMQVVIRECWVPYLKLHLLLPGRHVSSLNSLIFSVIDFIWSRLIFFRHLTQFLTKRPHLTPHQPIHWRMEFPYRLDCPCLFKLLVLPRLLNQL